MRKTKITIASVLALLGVYSVLDTWDIVPGVLTAEERIPKPEQFPSVRELHPQPDSVALENGELAPLPDTGAITAALEALRDDERVRAGVVAADVRDLVTGEQLAALSPGRPSKPASVTKILTETASLIELGADATFPTTVQRAGEDLYLVGGGDVLLGAGESDPNSTVGYAGLATLAQSAAQGLQSAGITSATVHVDTSLFSGGAYASGVKEENRMWVMEASPIAINRSHNSDSMPTPDPAGVAGRTFAEALSTQGITATFDGVGVAPDESQEIARVESAPLRQILEVMSKESDNTLADTLARLVAIHHGSDSTFDNIQGTFIDIFTEAGWPVDGLILRDGSGLSEDNRIAPQLLAKILHDTWQCMASGEVCALESLPFSLPVATVDGTLTQRYWNTPLAGQVWAKTGSLSTVRSLAGYVYTDAGRPLAFAIIVSDYPEDEGFAIPVAIDETIVAISRS
ncbi:MAG: D-alanyl-D-alanine carboxypeptidase/D-alanyl-D-alanine-endopeptidase [Actinomycetaceae bacterium]|nr:D-alanyl-D-alanine carboxypeptidase/D-alanyl-D-alanine-endopeptidase [Arcanobacterium sp.]MDD7504929.1 D-alanyl-D-alanine carboxypeptidase/D-alanyl-D-alanine-endopeptidase [Actinomycetaceae bacterium]MDY6143275.1 D-alanyl-D-alanine carboxypeptidase/D-alanyl-D-alanine-endopeptidase [Arcanobacterium sp.]